MKKIYLLSLLSISLATAIAQDCKIQAANKPSSTVRFEDYTYKPNDGSKVIINLAKINPQLNKAESWIKNILKNFTGAKLAYSKDYWFDYTSGNSKSFYDATGIKGSYTSKMRFYAYYCYDNNNKIFTEDESGSYADVVFNNVFSSGLCKPEHVSINGKYSFQIFKKENTEGRIDFYEQIVQNNANGKMYTGHDFIFLRNSDKPVFIAITRKEYLQHLLNDVEEYKKRETVYAKQEYTPANEAANKARFDDELRRIDNSKNYTKEQMAPYRKMLVETWETEKQKFDKRMSKLEVESSKATKVLLEYLQKPAAWLSKSINRFYGYSAYTAEGVTDFVENLDKIRRNGVGETEEETAEEIVSINPAYFNKTLSADVPQLIMVHLQNGSYNHMQKVAALVKQPGALAPLEAMLNSK